MADFSQMSDEQLAGCVSSAESGEAVAEMVSRYTGLVLALAGKYSGGDNLFIKFSGRDRKSTRLNSSHAR